MSHGRWDLPCLFWRLRRLPERKCFQFYQIILRANRKYRIFLLPVLLYFSRKVGRLKRSILQHRCGFHRDMQALPPGLTGTSLLQSSSRPAGQTRKSKSSQPPGITWNTGNSQTGSSAQTRGWPGVGGSLRRGRTWSRSGLVQRMALLRWLILLAPWGVAGAELGMAAEKTCSLFRTRNWGWGLGCWEWLIEQGQKW